MTLKNFAGAVAVITGGASGIGLATAKALYAAGAHIVLGDINGQALQQAGLHVRESNPSATGQVILAEVDVTNEEKVQNLMHQALSISGHIDLVITSAGIGQGGPIDEFTGAEMQRIINVNFMGTYHAARAALSSMRPQGHGHFVFLCSVAGKVGVPMLTGYCASKWAVRGFSSALRAELHGSGIKVTTVYPAWVDTPMLQQESAATPMLNIEVLLTPEQVAEEILQAVLEEKTDLTLAPNQDIAFLIQVAKEDPDKAEELAGAAYQYQLQKQQGHV